MRNWPGSESRAAASLSNIPISSSSWTNTKSELFSCEWDEKPIRYCHWFSTQTVHLKLFDSNCVVELVLKYNVNRNEFLIYSMTTHTRTRIRKSFNGLQVVVCWGTSRLFGSFAISIHKSLDACTPRWLWLFRYKLFNDLVLCSQTLTNSKPPQEYALGSVSVLMATLCKGYMRSCGVVSAMCNTTCPENLWFARVSCWGSWSTRKLRRRVMSSWIVGAEMVHRIPINWNSSACLVHFDCRA